MSPSRRALKALNELLRRGNLRLETLTLDRLEQQRLDAADRIGWFDRPPFEVPPAFLKASYQLLLNELPKYRSRFDSFADASANDVRFQFGNGFYTSPDVEILYSIVRMHKPRRIVEIGCGNSTRVIRQALKDAGQACEHVAIDPKPRSEISQIVDRMVREPIELANAIPDVEGLNAGDILFIDTSHEVRPANDVSHIYCSLLHKLRPGVVVHIHDIFLPYEYPRSWVKEDRLMWGEQYIVHAMLMNGANWEVLWPGYYLQRTLPEFGKHFPHLGGGMAQSLWLRTVPHHRVRNS